MARDWREKPAKPLRDADGTMFRHTNFYPAEQYDRQAFRANGGNAARKVWATWKFICITASKRTGHV